MNKEVNKEQEVKSKLNSIIEQYNTKLSQISGHISGWLFAPSLLCAKPGSSIYKKNKKKEG